ncbi:type IV secretion system protein [Phaeobacter sp. HS012]|uniref:type IV secretion system protein n=1 Tax=unclassified Phaeobacter TaxID=2621772 RepID=UPI001B3963E4|nr:MULTISPECIES: type IV secretion system protein [unclassified Phaeobacter]MBQ4808550.1 type IV secretion system protein [Phaeobacter sp. HS012]MBQ4883231.1 type IV secretion system protein [Phaeobacter sp. HS011]
MMGIVSFIVEAADQGLETVATSQFSAISEVFGTVIVGAATVAVIALFINMAWQVRPMDGREMLILLFKIGLIDAFALNWANFNFVSGSLIDGLDRLAGSLVGSVTGEEGAGPEYFAARFDLQLDRLAEYGNSATSHMGAVSKAVMGVFFMALLAVVGGAAGAVLVLAKLMTTFLIGIAPVMILCSMFSVTQDYFHRWLSSLASFALYPVVVAGIFSMVFGLVGLLVSEIGAADSIEQVGATIPFLAVVMLSLAMVMAIPFIVPMISGNLQAGWAASAVGGVARRLTLQHRLQQPNRPSSNTTSHTNRRLNTGSEAPQPRTPAKDARPSTATGEKVQRMKDRADRLRN